VQYDLQNAFPYWHGIDFVRWDDRGNAKMRSEWNKDSIVFGQESGTLPIVKGFSIVRTSMNKVNINDAYPL
jgi:hypothetical protein